MASMISKAKKMTGNQTMMARDKPQLVTQAPLMAASPPAPRAIQPKMAAVGNAMATPPAKKSAYATMTQKRPVKTMR